MTRKLADSVVVITGASSGIGRAAALTFAGRGATLVLAARREQPLKTLATECQRLGVRAIAVPTDVADESQVQALARAAVESFGRIDVWVNNAAVTLFSRFEEAPPEVWDRVIEVNLFGYVHGARAAMPIFREQGSGVLINNASIMGRVGGPYLSAYTASKFAIRGLAECLRQETFGTDIHVCTVLPGSIDTPLFQHAANYTGRAPKPMNPLNDAQVVADTIVRLAERPRREVLAGKGARMLSVMHTLMPGLHERMMRRQVEMDHFQDKPVEPNPGNVLEPMGAGTGVSGGWQSPQAARSRRLALFGLAAAVPAVLAWRRFGGRDGRQEQSRFRSLTRPVARTASRGLIRRIAA